MTLSRIPQRRALGAPCLHPFKIGTLSPGIPTQCSSKEWPVTGSIVVDAAAANVPKHDAVFYATPLSEKRAAQGSMHTDGAGCTAIPPGQGGRCAETRSGCTKGLDLCNTTSTSQCTNSSAQRA